MFQWQFQYVMLSKKELCSVAPHSLFHSDFCAFICPFYLLCRRERCLFIYLFILIMLLDKNRDYPFFCCNIGPFCCKDHCWSLLLLFLLLLTVCFVASAAAVYKLLFADHVVTFNAFV